MPAAPNTLPTLPLSGALLSTLQPATYLYHHLTHSETRPTTLRNPAETRPLSCTTSSLTHCAGSALVRCGDTTVLCGIQNEILAAKTVPDPPTPRLVPPKSITEAQVREQEDIAGLGLLVPNIELNTGCHPSFLPGEGRAPGQLQQSIAVRLLRLLLSSQLIPLDDLIIPRGREPQAADEEREDEEEVMGYWVLYITLLPLSLDGTHSLFDVAWTALLAALKDVKLPRAWWDTEREGIVCADAVSEARPLKLRGAPASLTFGVFQPGPHIWSAYAVREDADATMADVQNDSRDEEGNAKKSWTLVDPDGFEDGLCEETATVVVDKDQRGKIRVLALEKTGGSTVNAANTRELVESATRRWEEVKKLLPGG